MRISWGALGQEKFPRQQRLGGILQQQLANSFFNYIEVDLLPLTMIDELPLALGVATGPTDRDPIGCPVRSAAETTSLDKAFHQPYRRAVALEPIGLQALQTFPENGRSHLAHSPPRQNQKPDVVHRMSQETRSQFGLPIQADQPVSAIQPLDGRLPSQRSDQLPLLAMNQILQLGAYQAWGSQVMMPG